IRSRLDGIAAKETTPADEKDRLRALAVDPELNAPALTTFVRSSKLPIEDRRTVAELAARLSEDHKWLSPRELQEAVIPVADADGHVAATPFLSWASAANDKKQKFDRNPTANERPSEVERRSIDVAERLVMYQAYSGERFSSAGIILIQPRPSNAAYLAFTGAILRDARSGKKTEDALTPIERDALSALATYWKAIPRDDHKVPGEEPDADKRLTEWLRDSSAWIPLKTFLKSKPENLIAAGYPADTVKAFLDAYKAFEQAEAQYPGVIDPAVGARLLAASRALGETLTPQYPSVAMIERETQFNAVNPFWLAPFSYATALLVLVLTFTATQTTSEQSPVRKVARGTYWLGVAALIGGIGLEVYGFMRRIQISGWAPVTNMYETVIWVAFVAAVLALIFEVVYRPVFVGMAGAGVALLCTLTAASVPLLDPNLKSLQPVLRDNFWLGTHVLAEVSSYAAFALAWFLGLLATLFYLTATYRRSPRFGELALPLIPWLPVLAVGFTGVAASYGLLGQTWAVGDTLFYVCTTMALFGGMFTLGTLLSMGGEVVNRLTFHERPNHAEEIAGESWTAEDSAPAASFASAGGGGTATLVQPTVAQIRAIEAAGRVKLDARGEAMQRTAATVKPIANFVYRAMQVGVLLIAAGTILGGIWADYSWGRFWGWDAKEVWALATLIIYLVPLHGRFAGWVNTFWLVFSSVFCFLSVIMAWYGVNFVLNVGLHTYGFVEGASQGSMMIIIMCVLAFPLAAAWRRFLGYRTA
ncbi:MAG: cytochrome c biogenesis protein, partial [Isosphaeraceae bacterium]